MKATQILCGVKAMFLIRCFTEKKLNITLLSLWNVFRRSSVHCYKVLCRKAWCEESLMCAGIWDVLLLVLLCQACLQVWAWHCACCGTRSQGDPAVKDHVREQCCHVPSHGCLHSHHVRGNIWILIIWWMWLSVWRKE